jgi:2-hydroxycyclohexanecarboxyl-CoA dehydrogenase
MKTAFVTGGGGGIGSAVCAALARGDHQVVVADLDEDEARRVATEVRGIALHLDVTDPASVAAAAAAWTEGGSEPPSILVNCAGWDELRPFVETDDAFMARVLEINLAGALRVTRALFPAMLESGWGRVVNIASDAGRVGSSLEAIYSAAKGGLIAFTKTLAREGARFGVTANAVCPGPTDTPLLRGVARGPDAERVIASMAKAVPLGRIAQPADIAPLVAFLASEDAGYITGQTISVSGGLTMA